MSNKLNPDQARHFVGPDLGPNCLQRSSADDTSKQSGSKLFAKGYQQTSLVGKELSLEMLPETHVCFL